jgi:hypothetical protein
MSDFTDTQRLDWLAENRATVAFSDYVAQVATRDKGRATTYHRAPEIGPIEVVETLPVALRRSIDALMRRETCSLSAAGHHEA